MNENISLRIKFSVDDYVRVLQFMQSRMFFNKYGLIIAPLIIFPLSALFMFFSANDESSINYPGIFAASFIPALFIGVVIYSLNRFASPLLLKRTISKQYESSPAMQEEHLISFTDEGMENTNSLSNSKIKWEAIIKAVESETDLLFYTTNKFAHFVPKNAFTSGFDIDLLRGLLRVKLGDKAKF